MPLIPLKLPAGAYKNGTDLEGSDRWRDTNLVRWEGESLRPVGGWETRKEDAFVAVPRSLISWVDNSNNAHIVGGTYNKLIHVSPSGILADITPAGLVEGIEDASDNTSYGGSFYGSGFYGVTRPSGDIEVYATTWSLDTWGEYLVALSDADGNIYEWQLDASTPTVAAVVTNAPTINAAILVTEERFLMALGADANPRKVMWSDREDNTTWTATAENEAGDFELQTSGKIMGGVRMRGRTLIVTNTDAHTATYQGPPFVYGFERVGTACGAISRQCVVAIDEGAFWMGGQGFFHYNGSAVVDVPCDVRDHVFDDINRDQNSKVIAIHNSQFGELWWFYPSGSSIENDRYVALDYKEGHWHFGSLERTAAADRGVFNYPIWADSDGDLFNHELVGYSYGGDLPYAETGPVSLGNGDNVMKVNNLIPDEHTQGEVEVTFKTRFHPNDTEREYGPYTMSNPVGVRFTGRQVRMKIEAVSAGDWRAGIMRIEATSGGRR
jgi:hypothetical protein